MHSQYLRRIFLGKKGGWNGEASRRGEEKKGGERGYLWKKILKSTTAPHLRSKYQEEELCSHEVDRPSLAS